MRHFTAAEADDALDLVPMLEEADDVVLLEIEVVLVDSRAELHLFDDDHLLLLFRLGLFLLLLEQVLAVVHDLADRGSGRRGDLDEVEILLTSHLLGLRDGDDSDLLAFGIDQAHLGGADQVIDAVFRFDGSAIESWVTTWWENTNLLLGFRLRSEERRVGKECRSRWSGFG